jgi:hypothetical protein
MKKLHSLLAAAVTLFPLTAKPSGGTAHGFSGTQIFSTTGGSPLEPGEPAPCGMNYSTEWFLYTAAVNGTATLDTIGSSFDTVLALFWPFTQDQATLGPT